LTFSLNADDTAKEEFMTRGAVFYLMIAFVLITARSWAIAADSIESKPIHFAKGASSTTVKGTIKGYKTIDYTLHAKAGQAMSVALKSSKLSNYFNVLPPDSKDVAIFVGSTSGNVWTGTLETDGDYTIRVYLMRNAARRNETANYSLTVGITSSAAAAPALGPAPASDAKVKGTSYHATGQVPCSMGNAPQGSAQCDFGVVRGKPGNAEVHVTPAGGFKRVLTFMGKKVSANGDVNLKVSKSGDIWLIDVNDYEHYQIPEAVISGG
jgi:hypothetical protein